MLVENYYQIWHQVKIWISNLILEMLFVETHIHKGTIVSRDTEIQNASSLLKEKIPIFLPTTQYIHKRF